MNTPSSIENSEANKQLYNQLKYIAFDWRNKFPIYIKEGKLAMKLPSQELDTYLATIHDNISQTPLLSPQLLAQRLAVHGGSNKLTKYLPAGYRMCLTILPFNFGGSKFSESELANGFHLQELYVDQNNVAYSPISSTGSALFQVMPNEIKALSFISDGIRENILAEYEKTFIKAQSLFNKNAG